MGPFAEKSKPMCNATTLVRIQWILLAVVCIAFVISGNNIQSVVDYTVQPTTSTTALRSSAQDVHLQHELNPLSIPHGQAENLPSLRVADTKVDAKRHIYGGKGDGKHLGGFTELDLAGVSPAVWKHMLQKYGVHSVLDVGCGRGVSTSWFALHDCSPVMCVEGSHDAVENSIFGTIQPQSVVEHDFSRGPWWPGQTFDAVWSVEFLEHVGVNYHYNYISAFRKAAILFVTSNRWGGWHHVEVHGDDWWIRKYESYGFKYDAKMTEEIRAIAMAEKELPATDNRTIAPNGDKYDAYHLHISMKVFINPVVAAMPQHAHLFPEHGCYRQDSSSRICGSGSNGELESELPKSYWPLEPTTEQDEAWNNLIRKHVTSKK